jgi:hypothetical protein
MHKLKVLGVAVSLLRRPWRKRWEERQDRAARGLEPTYNDRHYNGCDQQGELSPGGDG